MPTVGLDRIEFGSRSDTVQNVYGVPYEIHIEDDNEVFEYPKEGLAFFFDNQSKQLNEIEIEREEVSVWAVQLMFTSIEDVNRVILKNTVAEVNTMQHDKTTYLFIEDLGLGFSFEDNALVTISAEA